MSVEEKIKELGLELPAATAPLGVYRPVVISGNHAYTSGHGPLSPDGFVKGRLGDDIDKDAAYEAAKYAGLAMLSSLKQELGSLDRIKRVVKVLGMVSSTPEFTEQPAVINGCSELFRDIFGEATGVGARSAVGVASLPAGWVVEIEGIFEIE